ncbi:MAG: Glutamate dehydrogenase [Parcubacteria group bacterium GW2011_GWC2_39_14]|nr:MAG: Glutamate dehydrogenase [Parcubacteria group bacterium GW2011_GWC2_39_14]KKR53400.1 MAG: Glutamate dehydrogenase [Parcubacteria group bacterium GW2011_GWA2_40_23]
MQNQFENALQQLDKAAKVINLEEEVLTQLRTPDRILQIKVPVVMDDGSLKNFEGYRVQHNNWAGPYKGGLRYFPSVDLNEVKALALWMTIKCSVAGIPMGGGKGGITVDPKKLSPGELERMTKSFARALAPNIGAQVDVAAPDVYTNGQIMAWILDEYTKITGKEELALITGKPMERGGSAGRDRATAMGAFYVLKALLEKINLNVFETAIAIQGFGNAGGVMAELCFADGIKVVATSDSSGGIYNEAGLNIAALMKHKQSTGAVTGFSGATSVTNEALLELPVTILIPAALENQITGANAERIKAKYIIELANGPVTPEGDEILAKNGIKSVPDVLANSGGVTVSYFEWEQNIKNEKWTEADVFVKLKEIIVPAFEDVWNKHLDKQIDLRTAAFARALEKLRSLWYNDVRKKFNN